MSRLLTVAAGQLGPIARNDSRKAVVGRLIDLMRQAHEMKCELIVYPELALTSFFPRWWMEDREEIDSFFEHEMPGPDTGALFNEAKRLKMGFYLGYAELAVEDQQPRHYNTSIIVDREARIVGKYRKIHLPGHADHRPKYPFQHLEKRYFDVGNLGFGAWRAFDGIVGMCICNDRRWPETYRVMGLQGVELIVLGYNTPSVNAQRSAEGPEKRLFHNRLCVQAGAYQNSTWVVAVAKAGSEDGHPLIAGSIVVSPDGEILAEAKTEDDELVVADCDLDATLFGKQTIFDFERHRRIEHYGRITGQTGAIPPPER